MTNRDCKLLVNTIEMALDNDEACKPMISRAFKLAKEKFDKEAVSEKFRMLLIDLIGKTNEYSDYCQRVSIKRRSTMGCV